MIASIRSAILIPAYYIEFSASLWQDLKRLVQKETGRPDIPILLRL